jgi:Flp pilus assembly protein TadD
VQKKRSNYLLLAFLGDALLRAGAVPGQPEFAEAQSAFQKSIAERGNFADAQLGLAKVCLLDNRVDDALRWLRSAQQLQPRNPSIYANLAAAYRRKGDTRNAEAALAMLQQINEEQAARIGAAPGDRKAGYSQHSPH